MIFGMIVMGAVGILLIVLGYLIWRKEKISLLHDYHYDKVAPEDKKVFCTLCGIGVVIIGVGVLVYGVILGLTDSFLSLLALLAGFVAGLSLLIYATVKYNSQK